MHAQAEVDDQQIIESFPLSLQLYPRDLVTNESIVPISGVVDQEIFRQIRIEVLRGDVLWFESTQLLEDQNSYSHQVSIQTELMDYTFNLYGITHTDQQILLKSAERIVSGDAFLIHGQSNAVGTGASNEPNIRADRHPFSRTFGSTVRDETVVDYPYWYEATTRIAYSEGATSVWAGRLCFRIIETQGIPCATINGAYPGAASTAFLPNVEDRFDLTTVYGRLLWRSRESSLQDEYRAIFWYQGESDGINADLYADNMEALFQQWADDYQSLEHTFILQIRYGCGTIEYDNTLFEVQRRYKGRSNTTVIPTNGIAWYDGCHYHAPGYEILADQLYYPVVEEMYGASRVSNVVAPDILSAQQTGLREIVITLDVPEGDELIVEDGFHIDFSIIDDDGEIITPIGGVLEGNDIILTLRRNAILFNGNVGYVNGKTYIDLGLNVDYIPRIMNLNGVHLLNFWDKPIEPLFLPTEIQLSSTTAEQWHTSLSTVLVGSSLLSVATLLCMGINPHARKKQAKAS